MRWYFIVLICILAILVFTCFFIGYKMFVYATHKIEPRLDITQVKRFKPYFDVVKDAVDYYNNVKKEEVEIKSDDNLTLKADFIKQDNAKATLILLHGYRSSGIVDFSTMLKYYIEQGYNLLVIHQRSCGISDGKYITFGIKERYDCLAWINFINERLDSNLPIFLHGVSMGAATAVMVLGFDLPSNVKGVISDCGYDAPFNICAKVLKKNMHLPPFPILYITCLFGKLIAKFNLKSYDCKKALKNNKLPVVFIHGNGDDFVPYELGVNNYNNCNSAKELHTFECEPHAVSMLYDAQKYQEIVTKFIENNL